MNDEIVLKTFTTSFEANIVAGRLKASGIYARVSSDDCGGSREFLNLSNGAKLWIKKEDIEKAKECLS